MVLTFGGKFSRYYISKVYGMVWYSFPKGLKIQKNNVDLFLGGGRMPCRGFSGGTRLGIGNACLKSFEILDSVYRHDPSDIAVFEAVALLEQLSVKYGSQLFNVKYKVVF